MHLRAWHTQTRRRPRHCVRLYCRLRQGTHPLEPSDPAGHVTQAQALTRRLLALLALGLIIHLVFGWLLTLSVDEAHYMYYALRLDWSYFDHPPLVGWAQWPLVAIGAPVGVIRLVPQLLWLVSCLLAWHLARNLHRVVTAWPARLAQSAGVWAVGLTLLAPVMHVLAVGLLPDTLLMTLTLALMSVTLTLVRPARDDSRQLGTWIALGVLLGLAGLAKYTAILAAAAVAIALTTRRGPEVLSVAGPWIATLVAAVLVVPVFYWNATHDWISFAYQLNHGTGGTWQLRRLAAFFGVQVLAYGPLLFLGTAVAVRQVLRARAWDAATLMLFFAIPFAVTAWLSGGGGSLPHWTAPAWLAMTPFAANAVAGMWDAGRHELIKALARTQAVICLLAFVVLFFGGIPGIGQDHPFGRKNPIADLWGWDDAGARARAIAHERGVAALAVGNWTLASRLAWYARPLPVHVVDDRVDQFDLWFGPIKPASDAIYLAWSQMPLDLPVGPARFASCDLIGDLDIVRLGRVLSDFRFYHCRNWDTPSTSESAMGKP